MSTYPYSLSQFVSSEGQVDELSLFSIVSHDASIADSLLSVTQTPPDTVTFTYADPLSPDEQTSLDNNVANYNYPSYAFSFSQDFHHATQVDATDLSDMINSDAAVGAQVTGIAQATSDVVWLFMSAALTSDQLDALTTDIGNYVFIAYTNDNVIGISEVQPPGTNGGTFTSGAWRTRTLNKISSVVRWGSVDTVSSQFTLKGNSGAPSSYLVTALLPARGVGAHQGRLQNITAGTTMVSGTADYSSVDATKSVFSIRLTLAADTTFEAQHICQTTVPDTGFGSAGGFTGTLNELYTMINVQKF